MLVDIETKETYTIRDCKLFKGNLKVTLCNGYVCDNRYLGTDFGCFNRKSCRGPAGKILQVLASDGIEGGILMKNVDDEVMGIFFPKSVSSIGSLYVSMSTRIELDYFELKNLEHVDQALSYTHFVDTKNHAPVFWLDEKLKSAISNVYNAKDCPI